MTCDHRIPLNRDCDDCCWDIEVAEQRRRSGRVAALCFFAAAALVALAWRLAR